MRYPVFPELCLIAKETEQGVTISLINVTNHTTFVKGISSFEVGCTKSQRFKLWILGCPVFGSLPYHVE